MRFETKKNKFLGKWRYQAQFTHAEHTKPVTQWFHGRNFGEFVIVGDSFYTNELQDVFVLRIQFDAHLKTIRQSEF